MLCRTLTLAAALRSCVQSSLHCGAVTSPAVYSSASSSSSETIFLASRHVHTLAAPSRPLLAGKKHRRVAAAVPRAVKHRYASQQRRTHASPSGASVDAPHAPSTVSAVAPPEPKQPEREERSATPSPASPSTGASPLQPQAQVQNNVANPSPDEATARPRRRYTVSPGAADQHVQLLKRELLQTRLRLAKAENTNAALYEGVLARLDETDRAALQTASSLRYTGMALRCAQDNLEVELRRLLTIGLTKDDVDAAAMEAGARQYVRQNIGFHAQHVASEPSTVTSVDVASRRPSLPKKP